MGKYYIRRNRQMKKLDDQRSFQDCQPKANPVDIDIDSGKEGCVIEKAADLRVEGAGLQFLVTYSDKLGYEMEWRVRH